MEGRRKEAKLIVKDGENAVFEKVVEEIRNMLKNENDSISTAENFFYTDTYYDDEESTLLKQGGSLKVRDGVFPGPYTSRSQMLVMRTRTTNPKKLEYTEWDEVEEPFYKTGRENFADKFSAIRGLFPDFDFDKILEAPVLQCKTSRIQYQIIKNGEPLTLMLDHVEYVVEGLTASDELIKIRTKSLEKAEIMKVYEALMQKFSQYELIEDSRYERALEKLYA